jgi:voltage-dependent potassium channel beta subunit
VEYRRLGHSGLRLSALGLGSWLTFGRTVDAPAAQTLMRTAYEAGVNLFDNAEAYACGESERVMGQALRELGWPRDSYCVSTKVFFGAVPEPRPNQHGLSRKHVLAACDASLERLQLEFVDLYLCHRADPDTPVEETVRAMDDLIRHGKVLYWGTSEWPASRIAEASAFARREHLSLPAVEQPQYNLFVRRNVEQQLAPLYADPGIGLTTWSPLYSGLLTGKYNDGLPSEGRGSLPALQWARDELTTAAGQQRLAAARQLTGLARELGISPAALSIAWCLTNPRVTCVLLGARRLEQLEQNLAALAALPLLTPAVMARIAALAASDA